MSDTDPFDSNKDKVYLNELGMKARVDRGKFTGDEARTANRTLREMGTQLNPIPETLEYLGSAAFHVYVAPVTGFVQLVSQIDTMQDCPVYYANAAQANFNNDLLEFYTGKRRKRRSGF